MQTEPMSHPRRIRAALAVAGILIAVTGCAPTTTPAPSASASASTEPSPGTSTSASIEPSAAVTPCPIVADEGAFRSRKLVSVAVVPGVDGDLVVFTFDFDAPTGTAQPTARLDAAEPPFTADPSGLPLEVPGERFVRVRFSGMILYDEAGVPTYTGDERIEPAGAAAVRAVVREGEFEGVSSWLIGFDGPGCVTTSPSTGTTAAIRVSAAP
jgi:hypothetical protein